MTHAAFIELGRNPSEMNPQRLIYEELKNHLGIEVIDKQPFEALMKKGCEGAHVTTLGVVGSLNSAGELVVPGIRAINAITQMYQLAQDIESRGKGKPIPQLFYPVVSNAHANSSDADLNRYYARAHYQMAERFRQIVFPDVAPTEALIDNSSGLPVLIEKAEEMAPHFSKQTTDRLLQMARSHSVGQEQSDDELLKRSLVYFLSHYAGYRSGVDIPEYLDIQGDRIFLVPQSERGFMRALRVEQHVIDNHFGVERRDNGIEVRAMSTDINRPPYYLYDNEGPLSEFTGFHDSGFYIEAGMLIPDSEAYRERVAVAARLSNIFGEREQYIVNDVIQPYVDDLQRVAQDFGVPIHLHS